MKRFTLTLLAAAAFTTAHAQMPIERVKMTDNDLSCQQAYNEITQMDGVIARANQPVAAAPVAAAPVDPNAGQGAAVAGAVAGAVAQQAIANAAVRSGYGFGGGFGGLGGLFGGLAQQAAAQQAAQQATAQQMAQQQAVQQAGQQQANAQLAQQAQGRKDHLTGLFLSKGCKMSEIQKQG